MVAAVRLFAKVFVFKGVRLGGVISLPTRVELVELMGCIWGETKEGFEEFSGIFVVWRENRIGREWSSGNLDDCQVGRWGF